MMTVTLWPKEWGGGMMDGGINNNPGLRVLRSAAAVDVLVKRKE